MNGGILFFNKSFFLSFYRAMQYSAKRGLAITCRLSVRPSARLSVCDAGGSWPHRWKILETNYANRSS